MAITNTKSKIERARQWLKQGGVTRDDSDDELGVVDYPWEWIYGEQKQLLSPKSTEEDGKDASPNKRKRKVSALAAEANSGEEIIGAKMGPFRCQIGDTVLLKADGNEAWVGIICELYDDEEGEKMANFMWFSSPKEIRNKEKKRSDAMQNELYISPSWDNNPLSAINGTAFVMSLQEYNRRFPKGSIPRHAKEYGKAFICRRGCNTRTATYTDEFIWEDILGSAHDLPSMIALIKTQTKASRKRGAGKPKRDGSVRGGDEFNDDENDDNVPKTPSKRRKIEAATPTSRHKKDNISPRKYATPSHKRIVLKKALEFTPLGTRILSPHALSSPYQIARNQLHVSSVPTSLPCREEEFQEVYTQLEKAITDGSGSCIYIAGTPGTGKTATVREVVAQLNAAVMAEELDDFIFVEINGMKVTDPHQSYSLLWEALRGDRVSPWTALDLLEREFSAPSPRRVPCVVLMDELDQLVTKNQSVMYNFFNWPQLRHSRLIVLAVANTMDLPERTLSNKISSRLGLHRITFKGYTHSQLITIIESRLRNVPGNVVHPDAIQFASRKVAAVSGDARRALDICRRAVEIAEADSLGQDSTAADEPEAPNTPSKSGRGKKQLEDGDQTVAKKKEIVVTIATIKQAIVEATSSPLQQYLRSLPLASKLFLAALLARIRRTGIGEALVGDVFDEARNLGLMSQLPPLQEYLLLTAQSAESHRDTGVTPRKSKAKSLAAAARVVGLEAAVVELAEAGIVGVEHRRGERVRRVRLGVGDEEVKLALRDDDEVRGLGFNQS